MKAVLRLAIFWARSLSPSTKRIVVYGYPDNEGNSLEVLRWLAGRGSKNVTWLAADLDLCRTMASEMNLAVEILPRSSWRGFLRYLGSPLVFFTHGLYLSPRSPARKVVVNLWHGDGPKRNMMPNGGAPPGCHYVVSGAAVFGVDKQRFFEVPRSHLLVTGNPRVDAFAHPASDRQLAALGIHRPFVLYLPTYRVARSLGSTRGWSDVGEEVEDRRRAFVADLARIAAERGLQVVVKAHPLDDLTMGDEAGAIELSELQLQNLGLSLHRFMARAGGLVTDYSSVWIDYLGLDRPIGFMVDDLDAFAGNRGFSVPSLPDLLGGPILTGASTITDFLDDVVQGGRSTSAARRECVGRIQGEVRMGSTERLMTALRGRGLDDVIPS